jgi:hypothetical protein
MDIVGQYTTTLSSPAARVGLFIVGCLVLYVAFKVGRFLLQILFGLVGLALLGGSVWWFFFRS